MLLLCVSELYRIYEHGVLPVMTAAWPFNSSSWLSEMVKLVIAVIRVGDSRVNVNVSAREMSGPRVGKGCGCRQTRNSLYR